ncbi:MAG TPA: ABC transporter ATP-binding protein [Acidimicrobiales bacterium]|jgi:ATP-binding cassette, subfamily B, bacterial|nr:ABC transporter ATP-binding protein [Acidimicrobiales bacterium]
MPPDDRSTDEPPEAASDTTSLNNRAGWRLLGEMVRPQRKSVALGVLAGLAWTLAKVAVPSVTRLAIDRGIVDKEEGALARYVVIMLILGVISAICMGFRRYNAFGIAWRAETELRQRLFAHLQRLHFAFHDQAQTGHLMARSATDVQQAQQFLVMIPITISNVVTMVAITIILFSINPGLAALALCALPLINVFAKRFGQQVHPASLAMQAELAGLATVVEETITGIRVVKGFGAEQVQAERLGQQGQRALERALVLARIRARFNPILDFLPTLGLVAVLWYGGNQVLNGSLSLGELTAFNVYVVMLIPPLRMTGMLVAQAQRAVAAAQRIDEILATDPAIVDRTKAVELPTGGGDLVFDDVHFGYIEGRPVLNGFSMHVKPGESVAIVGATGSGKTTVARLIPRFYDIDGGRIMLDGTDIRDMKVRDLRQAVGIVFEDTFLFSDTIRNNIAFADPQASQEKVERAARLAGAHDFITSFEDGYDTMIGERGFSLSGGQRQRVALARAILADPRVLILDDATSSVDPTKEHEIREALAEVMRNRTTVVIAHRPATIALADRVVLLDGGRVVAEGTHEGLLQTEPRYREVLAQQAAYEAEKARKEAEGAGEDADADDAVVSA